MFTNTKDVININTARERIEGKKAIFVITNDSDLSNLIGYLYYISDNRDSYDDMMHEFHSLDISIDAMILGCYDTNGGKNVV